MSKIISNFSLIGREASGKIMVLGSSDRVDMKFVILDKVKQTFHGGNPVDVYVICDADTRIIHAINLVELTGCTLSHIINYQTEPTVIAKERY